MINNNSILFFTSLYSVNSAYANRLIATTKGLLENKLNVMVIFFYASVEVIDAFKKYNIPFKVLSKRKNRFINLFFSLFKSIKYLRGKKIIIQFTEPFLLHWFYFFSSSECNLFHERTEYPDAVKDSKWFKKFILPYYYWVCKKYQGIFVISDAIKKYFIQKGLDEKKLYIYPMLIDPQRFEICIQSTEVKTYIAYCGDMGGNKDGLWDLINAYTLFHSKVPNVKLYLIGDTKDVEQYNALENKVKSLNLEKDIVFTGRINREEIPSYLCQAAAMVLARPNNYQAQGGFPTKLGEYLATGKPVVITRTGEIDSYLEDNKDCFFVEPDNPQAFADRLCDVFADYDFASKVGQEGKKKVYNEFNYKVQTAKLIEFIEQVV